MAIIEVIFLLRLRTVVSYPLFVRTGVIYKYIFARFYNHNINATLSEVFPLYSILIYCNFSALSDSTLPEWK